MRNNRWIGWVVFLAIVGGVNALQYFGVFDLGFWLI
jgi:hypothetical protein